MPSGLVRSYNHYGLSSESGPLVSLSHVFMSAPVAHAFRLPRPTL